MPGGRERFQGALRDHTKHSVAYHGHEGRMQLADIVEPGPPVIAEVHGSNIELEEDQNLYLSQHVRQYATDYDLEAGDNLVVVMLGEGNWHALSVFSDNDTIPFQPLGEGDDGGSPSSSPDTEADGGGPTSTAEIEVDAGGP